jgi:hypothetical protein
MLRSLCVSFLVQDEANMSLERQKQIEETHSLEKQLLSTQTECSNNKKTFTIRHRQPNK